jgi:hypothetical protein
MNVHRVNLIFSPHQNFHLFQNIKMSSLHTPPPSKKRVEADTIKRTRFFHAYDQRERKTVKTMCMKENVSYETRKSWLCQRDTLSTSAFRRIGKARSGRHLKVTNDQLNEMLNDEKSRTRLVVRDSNRLFSVKLYVSYHEESMQPTTAQSWSKSHGHSQAH